MKYIDEYRDGALAQDLLGGIRRRADKIGRKITIMEVCGSHTTAIGRFGIRGLMPDTIRLISGPGCPVCVTSIEDVDKALQIARHKGVIFATFGDMLRVPGSAATSLQDIRADGADIRIISSPAQCIALAGSHTKQEIVLMGIGFETTSPAIASVVKTWKKTRTKNVSLFSVHKKIPPAIKALLGDPGLSIDAFLCPGHVSTIIGEQPYKVIADKGCAAVITGFEPLDILEGIYRILGQILSGDIRVENQYIRGVNPQGNAKALSLLDEVFKTADSSWRGLGSIEASGLVLNDTYAAFDAAGRFDLPAIVSEEPPGCRCGDILRGTILPEQCPLFNTLCTPANPVGPCMVSSEGTCAAYYNYT